jgi:signal transduction histidine kinase
MSALFVGILGSEALILRNDVSAMHIVAIGIVVAGSYGAVAQFLVKRLIFDPALPMLRDILALLAGGAIAACCSGAVLLALFYMSGDLRFNEIAGAAWAHVIGDVIGIGIVAPLALKFFTRAGFHRFNLNAKFEIACFVLTVGLFGFLIATSPSGEGLRFFYLLFIPAVLVAARHGMTGAALCLAGTQGALVVILDWVDTDPARFTDYQTLMLFLSATGLVVGAIVSERDNARLRVQAMEWEAARAARFNLVSGMAAVLSHEINQPLTAARARAKTLTYLLEREEWGRVCEQLGPLVNQIDKAADILSRLRDFLKRGTPDRKPIAWSAITSDAQMLLGPAAKAQHIQLSWRYEDPGVIVNCDHVQIEQVIVNLVSNAIEAIVLSTQRGGEIEIQAACHGSILNVSVHDNGPGVHPAIKDKLFNTITTTRMDGLGLGVLICQSIITSPGGRLWLAHSHPGDTQFEFQIPLTPKGT